MAKLYSRGKNNLYRIRYKHPEKIGSDNPWSDEYHKDKEQAEIALSKYIYIENCIKSGSDDWKRIFYGHETKTIQECFDFYQHQVLDEKLNADTERRYQCSMNSFLQIFSSNTSIASIRTMKRKVNNRNKIGIKIYKAEMSHLARRTVNSNLRDIRTIFEYCRLEDFITQDVVRRSDFYKPDDLPELNKKQWAPGELYALENDENIHEDDRDIIKLYYMTGCRASELMGYNYKNRDKEFHWHHVNFPSNEISIIGKRSKTRVKKYVSNEVMAILKKRKNKGYDRPIAMAYKRLRQTITRVNQITNISFTCHDLRRLNAQLVRTVGGLETAAASLGNSSLNVVNNHYAGISDQEKIKAANDMMSARDLWLQTGEA